MRRSIAIAVSLTIGSLFLASGCQRVNMQKTVKLGPGEVLAPFIVSAPSSSQTVTLTVSPSGTPVDVYIILEKDRATAEKGLQEGQAPQGTLAGKQKVDQETTLTATVPAKNGYAVIVANAAKDTSVAVKLAAR